MWTPDLQWRCPCSLAEKIWSFYQRVLDPLDSWWKKKKEPWLYYISCTKINSRWIVVINMKGTTVKLLEDNLEDLHDCCLLTQLCPTLYDPIDCSLPCSSVHGIFHARILECVAISSPKMTPTPHWEDNLEDLHDHRGNIPWQNAKITNHKGNILISSTSL